LVLSLSLNQIHFLLHDIQKSICIPPSLSLLYNAYKILPIQKFILFETLLVILSDSRQKRRNYPFTVNNLVTCEFSQQLDASNVSLHLPSLHNPQQFPPTSFLVKFVPQTSATPDRLDNS